VGLCAGKAACVLMQELRSRQVSTFMHGLMFCPSLNAMNFMVSYKRPYGTVTIRTVTAYKSVLRILSSQDDERKSHSAPSRSEFQEARQNISSNINTSLLAHGVAEWRFQEQYYSASFTAAGKQHNPTQRAQMIPAKLTEACKSIETVCLYTMAHF
jgi:hypothetical protein